MTTEQGPTAAKVDLKLEVVVIPVSDVDRAKRFYQDLVWRLDAVRQARWFARRATDAAGFADLDRRPRTKRPETC